MLSDPTEPIPVNIGSVLETHDRKGPVLSPASATAEPLCVEQCNSSAFRPTSYEQGTRVSVSCLSLHCLYFQNSQESVIWPKVSLRKIWYSRIPKFNKNMSVFIAINARISNSSLVMPSFCYLPTQMH